MSKNSKFLIISIGFLVLSYLLINNFPANETLSNEKLLLEKQEIIETKNKETIKVKNKNTINNLKSEYNNSDVIGTINFPSSKKTAPIMQTTNNDYYLNHTPDKKENYAGSIFLDYRLDIENSKKLLIYGHSSSYEELPFNFLQNYHNKDYFKNNQYIEIKNEKITKRYKIFSVYVETKDFSYMETDFANDDEYLSHLESLKNKSIYKTKTKLSKEDEILILQTCSTHKDYKNYENKYLLIISRRV